MAIEPGKDGHVRFSGKMVDIGRPSGACQLFCPLFPRVSLRSTLGYPQRSRRERVQRSAEGGIAGIAA